jgi:hypothetical protein
MTQFPLPDADDLRTHPELGALAALSVSLSLARQALWVDYPHDPDPLCARLHAADVVLHLIDRLEGALDRYHDVLAGHDPIRFP